MLMVCTESLKSDPIWDDGKGKGGEQLSTDCTCMAGRRFMKGYWEGCMWHTISFTSLPACTHRSWGACQEKVLGPNRREVLLQILPLWSMSTWSRCGHSGFLLHIFNHLFFPKEVWMLPFCSASRQPFESGTGILNFMAGIGLCLGRR